MWRQKIQNKVFNEENPVGCFTGLKLEGSKRASNIIARWPAASFKLWLSIVRPVDTVQPMEPQRKRVLLAPHGLAATLTNRKEDIVILNDEAETCRWTAIDTHRALKEYPHDVYLGLRFYHSDPLARLRDECRRKETRFTDDEFPVHASSLWNVKVPTDGTKTILCTPGIIASSNCHDFHAGGRPERIPSYLDYTRQWYWHRGSDMPGRQLVSCSTKSMDVRNVLQGKVGNCGFCAGFASLVAYWPELIQTALTREVMADEDSCGAWSVRLYPKGRERYLLLDDYVLCHHKDDQRRQQRGNHLHASPSLHSRLESDLWIRLLEKVFAKLQGSYASLDGHYKFKSLYRHPARALQLVTGAANAFEFHHGKGTSRDEIYDILQRTQGTYARVAHCRKRVQGLQSNHAYSLLWIGAVGSDDDPFNKDEVKLVCLRNPHGRGSYTGIFGRGVDTRRRLLNLNCFERCKQTDRVTWAKTKDQPPSATDETARNADDGIFIMDFATFTQCFPVTTLVGPLHANGSHTRAVPPISWDESEYVDRVGARYMKSILQESATAST